MKKTIIIVLICIAVVGIGVASFFGVRSYLNANKQSPEEVAQLYVELILENDYSQLMSYMDLPKETPFFSTIDIMHQIYNSKYAYIAGVVNGEYDIQVTTIDVSPSADNPTSAVCRTILKDINTGSNVTFDFNLVKRDKTWKIVDKEFYLDELYVVAPADAMATINGKDITKYPYQMYDEGNFLKMYIVPNVGCAEKSFGVKWANESEYRIKKTAPTKEQDLILCEVVAEGTPEMEQSVLNTWNDIHKIILNDGNVEQIKSLLHPNASIDVAQRIYDFKQNVIRKNDSFDLGIDLTTAKAVSVNVVPYSDLEQTSWINQDKVFLTFNFDIQWTGTDGTDYTMKAWDILVLQQDNEGVYKILFVYSYAPFWSIMTDVDQYHVEMNENLEIVTPSAPPTAEVIPPEETIVQDDNMPTIESNNETEPEPSISTTENTND